MILRYILILSAIFVMACNTDFSSNDIFTAIDETDTQKELLYFSQQCITGINTYSYLDKITIDLKASCVVNYVKEKSNCQYEVNDIVEVLMIETTTDNFFVLRIEGCDHLSTIQISEKIEVVEGEIVRFKIRRETSKYSYIADVIYE